MKNNKEIHNKITSEEYVNDAYKTCPCWSIIPGKSRKCLQYCPLIQRDACTVEYDKSLNKT